jgi:hypothetical protein
VSTGTSRGSDGLDRHAGRQRFALDCKFSGDLLDHYASGGQASRFRSRAVSGFKLSAGERADLLAFLNRLTDEAFLADPAFAAPH